MRRYFNTEGQCNPKKHYMVPLDQRLRQIKERYVDRGSYFVINRGRQYGKTTTLWALEAYLKADYAVLFMDFQLLSTANFENEHTFSISFAEYVERLLKDDQDLMEMVGAEAFEDFISVKDSEMVMLDRLFSGLSRLCGESKKPVVLMIDEVDSATNNQVFLDFLALLRGYYLNRERKAIFQSVILAGVYDIKNLKMKIRPEKEHKYNSPWNIAADFNIEMEFSASQIAGMLTEYEADISTGMDVDMIAGEIYQYTSGYPYLVSAICKMLDEELPGTERFPDEKSAWSKDGISESVKTLLKKNIPLFDNMAKQLDAYPDLRDMIQKVLYQGEQIPYSPLVQSVNLGIMFGFFREQNGYVVVSNRIFEMVLLNMFLAEEAVSSTAFRYGERDKNQFIKSGRLDMDLVLEKFVAHFNDIYGENDEKFIEEYGRKFFLLYLKPIINGAGNYYLEARTRDARRTDVIVDYQGEQFIVELKIWHGNEYNERGEAQLAEYLDYYHQEKGYLLSFNFNKKKEIGMKEIKLGDKTIIEAVV